MMWFGPKPSNGRSVAFRRGAFTTALGVSAVAMALAAVSAVIAADTRWPVPELAVMAAALAALPVAFLASGVRLGLAAGETKPARAGNEDYWVARLFFLLAVPFVSLGIGFALWHILLGRSGDIDGGASHLSGSQISAFWLFVVATGLATFLFLQFLCEIALHKFGDYYLTNRRVIRFTPGFWSGRIEVLRLADISEIRAGKYGIELIASSPDAMRRVRPDGSTEAAGIERLHLPLLRFRLPGTGMSQYDRAIQSIGLAPLRWHAPVLPRDVARLVAVNAIFLGIVMVAVGVPICIAFIADIARPIAVPGNSHDATVVAAFASSAVLLVLGALGYWLFLRLAMRRLTPDTAALFLRAMLHPDWAPDRWLQKPYAAARHAALRRREWIASRLAGRPVSFMDAPGPEAYDGGWHR